MGGTVTSVENPNIEHIVEYIDEKIDLVLEAPQAWGGEEPLEPLVLMLLMLRQFVVSNDDDEHQLLRAYRRHLAGSVGPGAARLIERLPDGDKCLAAVPILQEFVNRQRTEPSVRIPELPPEGHGSLRLVTEHDEVGISPYLRVAGD
jgi:hypothetical protein